MHEQSDSILFLEVFLGSLHLLCHDNLYFYKKPLLGYNYYMEVGHLHSIHDLVLRGLLEIGLSSLLVNHYQSYILLLCGDVVESVCLFSNDNLYFILVLELRLPLRMHTHDHFDT